MFIGEGCRYACALAEPFLVPPTARRADWPSVASYCCAPPFFGRRPGKFGSLALPNVVIYSVFHADLPVAKFPAWS
jgi:hypothetical protein